MDKSDEKFLQEAIELSKDNQDNGGGPFGAVIVKNGEVIARSGNTVTKDNDPTAHAEINAIRKASEKLQDFELKGCVLYSSCEPCPMCLGAIYWARLDRLCFAATREDAKDAGFDDSFIYKEIQLHYDRRNIPTEQAMRDVAIEAFEKWKNLDNKVEY
ncbi:MAG: nucleoside deaminase [Bacteroidales bacterium]